MINTITPAEMINTWTRGARGRDIWVQVQHAIAITNRCLLIQSGN